MMSDVKNREDAGIQDIGNIVANKSRLILTELERALGEYRTTVMKSTGEGEEVDANTELELMQSIAYISLLLNGLSTLFRQEVDTQVAFIRGDGVPDSVIVGKANEMRVKALGFIEALVTQVNGQVEQKFGNLMGLPDISKVKDAQTGRPIQETLAQAAGESKPNRNLN